MKKIITLLLTMAFLTAVSQEVLLKNGDFEQQLTDWNTWGLTKDNLTIIKDEVYSGKTAVRIAGTSNQTMTGLTQGQLALEPGKTYQLTFFVRHNIPIPKKLRMQAAILERGERGKVQKQHYRNVKIISNDQWNYCNVNFTLSEQPCKYYQLIIRLNNIGENEYVDIDAVTLMEYDINSILDRSSARMAAETAAVLEKMKKSSTAYQRRTERTVIFSRAQLKYGLQRNDYLHKWIDRPLLVDPSLPPAKGFINEYAYRTMQKIVKMYLLDGFAFFPETTGRQELYEKCLLPNAPMTVLTEIVVSSKDYDKKKKIIKKALDNPNSMRINGKLVLTSYPANDDEEYWQNLKKSLNDEFGDKFILMPYFKFYPDKFRKTGPNDSFSVADIEILKKRLRNWLRVVDGYYHNVPGLKNRRYYAPIDQDFIIPLIHSILMEEEFKHKYLAWGTKVGHENYELLGYAMDHAGTGMLRGTMESAIMAKADIINCVEWDEQNENTSFRPTLYNSFSTMRLLRYYRGILDQNPVPDLPGDDLSIPNLVLSYRKILVAGQILELEILNIPDQKPQEGYYQVELILKNLAGETVRKLPEQRLAKNKLDAMMLEIPVEDIVNHQVLLPELTVRNTGNGMFRITEGFQPIELRASWNWDYKWVKQPLRDILYEVKSELKVTQVFPDGTIELTGSLAALEPLNSIEIMDNGDVVYSHQKDNSLRETDEQVVFCINLQAKLARTGDIPVTLNGSIEFRNITVLKQQITGSTRNLVPGMENYFKEIDTEGFKWNFKNVSIQHLIRQIFVSLPRHELAKGELIINLPGYVEEKIKLSELMELGVKGYPGPGGFNLVVRRFNSQILLPDPWNKKSAEFQVRLTPSSPNSLLHLQAVSKTGKVYRGSSVSLFKPTGKTGDLAVFSLKHDRSIQIKLDQQLLTDFNYLFSPKYGSVLYTPGSREMLGISGGYIPQVTGRGSGESSYGNAGPRKPGMGDLYAKWLKEPDGTWSLDFQNSYVSLPHALIPPFGSFDLTLDIWPRSITGDQALLGCDATGFRLILKNGIPTVFIYQNNHYESQTTSIVSTVGPIVKLNSWNRIRVRSNQQKLKIWVNNQEGPEIDASGYQRYPRVFGLGVDQRRGDYFDGKIRKLRVQHKLTD